MWWKNKIEIIIFWRKPIGLYTEKRSDLNWHTGSKIKVVLFLKKKKHKLLRFFETESKHVLLFFFLLLTQFWSLWGLNNLEINSFGFQQKLIFRALWHAESNCVFKFGIFSKVIEMAHIEVPRVQHLTFFISSKWIMAWMLCTYLSKLCSVRLLRYYQSA